MMEPSRHFVQTGSALRDELISIIGDAEKTDRVIYDWCARAAVLGNAPTDFLTGPDPGTDAERTKRLGQIQTHIDALIPLLDRSTSSLIAWASPGIFDGPEVAYETESRLVALRFDLERLGADVRRAVLAAPAAGRGRPLRPTPRVVLMIALMADLRDVGIPSSAAENSKMVRAARILWSSAEFAEDPRDLLRTLLGRQKRGA